VNGRGNVGVGGNDPNVASGIQQTANMVNPPAPPGQMMPQGQGPQMPQNEVAIYLAKAFDALSRTGPTPENLAALRGFRASLQQLGQGMEQAPGQAPPGPQGPPGPQMPMPGGQAGMPLPPQG